tara:strand:+ start:849 stop:1340 length:492 start_codon:yes stop_codon:yes gene_type:complete
MISSESPTTSDNNTMDQHTYNGNHHENYDNNDNMKDPLRRFSFDSKGDDDDDDDENESEHGNTTAMSMLMNYYGTEKIDPEQETKSPAELIKSVSFKPDAYVKELLDTKQVHELIKHDAQMLVCMFILYIYRMYIVCISYVYRMYTYSYDNSQRTQIYISVYT